MILTKSQQLLYTIIQNLGTIDDKIKLAKFEYFSDFIHYAFYNSPISDDANIYEKRPYGPLSRNFNADLKALISSGLIEQIGKYKYKIKKNIDNTLTKKETSVIDYVLKKYSKYSYDVLTDITHKQIPYLSATEGGIVEYDTAYNLVDEYTDYQTI